MSPNGKSPDARLPSVIPLDSSSFRHRFQRSIYLSALILLCALGTAQGGTLDDPGVQADLVRLTDGFDGRVGVCALDAKGPICVAGAEHFSMQSVMKLIVGMAVMDAVDHGQLHLQDAVVVRREDLSLFVEPIAALVGPQGFPTTVGDLVRRTIVDSDSAATDILIAKLGGPRQVEAFLTRKGIDEVRVDRDERHLQTEMLGLTWKPAYVDSATFKEAVDAVPLRQRNIAYRHYRADPRDTATPEGMVTLLQQLATGKLLSTSSTNFLIGVMKETATFPDRLKAGVPKDWTLAHKTGTSGSWGGVTAATNDVGILQAPDGGLLSLAVFIGDSRASEPARAALMAQIAAAVIAHYH
jgi:beta-lactamase class A